MPMSLIKSPTAENLSMAARNLRDGALLGFPTETVYGLAADAVNEYAVKRIYDVKGRPADHPLIVHIGSLEFLYEWVTEIPDYSRLLINRFWPGPLTLIFKKSKIAKNFITGGLDTIAVRMPKHEIAMSILNEFHKIGGKGIAAPSANMFGKVSPTSADAVFSEIGIRLKENDFIIDGGKCEVGIESTILSCLEKEPKIFRPGTITKEMLSECLQTTVGIISLDKEIKVSGNFKSHYSPKVQIVINEKPKPGDGFLALKEIKNDSKVIRIEKPENYVQFAKILYSSFRKADQLKLDRLVIWLEITDGVSFALMDRIQKAAVKINNII